MIDGQLKQSFTDPPGEFSPMPFWFWNDALDEEKLRHQIMDFKEKGVEGFIIHPRMGIPEDIVYLSDAFMHYVKFAVELAHRLEMKVILYDEAMYPSGSAHGMVVQENPDFAAKCLRMYTEAEFAALKADSPQSAPAVVSVRTMADGRTFVFAEEFSGGTIRGIHPGEDDGEENAPLAGDLLNPEAVKTFIRLTYDRYYEVLHEYFGSTIIAMFTDEPDVLGRNHKKGARPYTSGLLKEYLAAGGKEADLPFLWLTGEPEEAEINRRYQKVVNQVLARSYYRQISKWCEAHGIALTGHPHESDDIGLLSYFHIPGQDIVWRWVAPEDHKGIEGTHSTMGKCSSDAARHGGQRRNANECFGCCGPAGNHWAFSADDMKWYLDWLFVRGVNMLYPHAFYYSLEGEMRFGERPPDVGLNNIWWEHYRYFSDYIKRMSWLLTDSYNVTGLAVLCQEDYLPWEFAKTLFEHQVEFNYLEDNLIVSGQCRVESGCLVIEKQRYHTLLVEDPGLLTPRLDEILSGFMAGGGSVLTALPEQKNGILQADDFSITPPQTALRATHVRKSGYDFYLLTNEGEQPIWGRLSFGVSGYMEQWNPWTGEMIPVSDPVLYLNRRESTVFVINPVRQRTDQEKENVLNQPAATCTTMVLKPVTRDADYALVQEYEMEFFLAGQPKRLWLVLEGVHEIAKLEVNGQAAGVRLWAPFEFDLTGYAECGNNKIRVKITDSLANRYGIPKPHQRLLAGAQLTINQ